MDPLTILQRLAEMPVSEWRYTNESASVKHLGPTAQDFKAAFNLGSDDKAIGTVDESGVALAAIQGLNEKVDARDEKIAEQAGEITDLKTRLARLEELISKKGGN